MGSSRFSQFAPLMSELPDAAFGSPAMLDSRLVLAREGRLTIAYAPFDHIEQGARLVLVGLTPGHQQMVAALRAAREALRMGTGYAEAAARAKRTASFAGPMRRNLADMLDHLGLARWLGAGSCAEMWDREGFVHFTSALRYPVFIDGKNYSGQPNLLRTPLLRGFVETTLSEEVRHLQHALFVPLGEGAAAALLHLVKRGQLARERVLDGLPHPSGANAERIAYFLGRKARSELETRTDPDRIDAARTALELRVAQLTS